MCVLSELLVYMCRTHLMSYCKTTTLNLISLPFRSIGESAIWISANIFSSYGPQSTGEIQERNWIKFSEFASWYNSAGFAVRLCMCNIDDQPRMLLLLLLSIHFILNHVLFSTLGCPMAGDA